MLRRVLLTVCLPVLASPPATAQDTPLQLAVVQDEAGSKSRDLRLVIPADGYLLMLQAVDGDVHVMFPAAPGSAAGIRAGEYDLARLDTRIPYANGRDRGEIVAVWSKTPLRMADFVRYGHWATSSLSRQEFKRDAATATIDLATRLGATSGMAASVEYGSLHTGSPVLAVHTYVPDARQTYEWKVYQNLSRIQGNCPVGSRDVIGSGEYCSSPTDRPRSSPKPTTGRVQEPEQPYVPPRPAPRPAATRSVSAPPPAPAVRPTEPAAQRRPKLPN